MPRNVFGRRSHLGLQELARRVGNPAPLCPCRRRVYLSALLSCQVEDTSWETVVGELSAGAWGSRVSRGCAGTAHVSKVRAGVLSVPPLRGAECPSVAVRTLAPGSVDDTRAGRVVTALVLCSPRAGVWCCQAPGSGVASRLCFAALFVNPFSCSRAEAERRVSVDRPRL